MNFRNLTQSRDYKIQKYLEANIDNLSPRQKLDIYHLVQEMPFKFYERKKYTSSIWIRISIILVPFVWFILFIFLPFTYIFTGTWGYGYKMNWLLNWFDKVKA